MGMLTQKVRKTDNKCGMNINRILDLCNKNGEVAQAINLVKL